MSSLKHADRIPKPITPITPIVAGTPALDPTRPSVAATLERIACDLLRGTAKRYHEAVALYEDARHRAGSELEELVNLAYGDVQDAEVQLIRMVVAYTGRGDHAINWTTVKDAELRYFAARSVQLDGRVYVVAPTDEYACDPPVPDGTVPDYPERSARVLGLTVVEAGRSASLDGDGDGEGDGTGEGVAR
jgi:hypothetical protein